MPNTYTRYDPVGRRSRHGGMFPFWKRAAKRHAKRAEWAAFLREEAALARADAHSLRVLTVEQEREVDDSLEIEARIRGERNERWLSQLGHGTTFWEHYPRDVNPDTWLLGRVEHDPYEDEYYCCFECNGRLPFASWGVRPLAVVSIDRAALQWVISYEPPIEGCPETRLEYAQHSLEQVQVAAALGCALASHDPQDPHGR